eukprot:1379331-Rhodomonas_salina.2
MRCLCPVRSLFEDHVRCCDETPSTHCCGATWYGGTCTSKGKRMRTNFGGTDGVQWYCGTVRTNSAVLTGCGGTAGLYWAGGGAGEEGEGEAPRRTCRQPQKLPRAPPRNFRPPRQ